MERIEINWDDVERQLVIGNADREKLIKLQMRHIAEFGMKAIRADQEHREVLKRADEAEAAGELEKAKMHRQRAEAIHKERCLAIKAVAQAGRSATSLAAGDLTIDETTVGTGLMPDERRLVFNVQHAGEND